MRGQKRNTPGRKPARSPRGDRSKRLLDLVMLLLRTRSPVTFREIREQFTAYKTQNADAGLRAFERDKADLLELGVPIRYITPDEDDALDEGGYVVDLKRYRLPEVALTADEVSALVLAASVARAVPGGSTPKIVDLTLKKMAFDAPEAPDTPVEFPPPVSAVTAREPVLVHFPAARSSNAREISERFAEIERATRDRKRITVSYRSAASGLITSRDIDPYGLIYRQRSWVLVGYCHLRKEVRSFRIDRIASLRIAPKPKSPDFERPADFDVRAFANRSPWTFETGPAEDVELEIRAEAADVANEDFGPHATRSGGKDGVVLVRFRCTNHDYAVSQVLRAKGGICVRRGKRLRKLVADEVAAIERHYE